VIDFIDSPDLQVIHGISIGDCPETKIGFCDIEFRKLYKHPFFNNFLKSLDDKAKTVILLSKNLQSYQGTPNHDDP
jgi:nitrous oxide reductase